jgi:5-methylcytosine-specific restriction protein A
MQKAARLISSVRPDDTKTATRAHAAGDRTMSERAFRTPESYQAERITRDMLEGFLISRGFVDVRDERKSHGKTESQTLHATSPAGDRLAMRVRLCWRRTNRGPSETTYSAAQLLPKIKNDDWEGTLRSKVEREKAAGATHLLIVQREVSSIVYAALVPLSDLVAIWSAQARVSQALIDARRLGRRQKNHAKNGSSPTIWLQDNRAPEVAAVLWDHHGVQDLAALPVFITRSQDVDFDDTFDDIPGLDYSRIGSDGAPAVKTTRSNVKRDHRVRAAVLERARGKCERTECGTARDYSGFFDVHHILGAEKSDRVWNCVALCPNCHREAHAAPDQEEINAHLLAFARRFRSPS